VAYYDPPEMTYPFGAYVCVVEIDKGTGQVGSNAFIAVDDCGVRINPMIVEGQIHGGLAQGIGTALMEVIEFDEEGNHLNSNFMDYLIPTSMEVPKGGRTGETVTPSTHHPLGARGVAESPTVGSPAAVVNAVVDALSPYGVRHVDMPLTPSKVWPSPRERGGALLDGPPRSQPPCPPRRLAAAGGRAGERRAPLRRRHGGAHGAGDLGPRGGPRHRVPGRERGGLGRRRVHRSHGA
jgi:hypothetical protein